MAVSRVVVGAAVALVVLLAGCGGADPGGSGSPAPSRSPAAVDGGNDAEQDLPPLPPPPTWDAASREAAARAGARVMRAFARPNLPAARWWAELEPLLSPAARTAYAGTDPSNVPAAAVTGPAVFLDNTNGSHGSSDASGSGEGAGGASPWLARVEVQTDVGRYVVLLSRTDQGSAWLAERLEPPASLRAP